MQFRSQQCGVGLKLSQVCKVYHNHINGHTQANTHTDTHTIILILIVAFVFCSPSPSPSLSVCLICILVHLYLLIYKCETHVDRRTPRATKLTRFRPKGSPQPIF